MKQNEAAATTKIIYIMNDLEEEMKKMKHSLQILGIRICYWK